MCSTIINKDIQTNIKSRKNSWLKAIVIFLIVVALVGAYFVGNYYLALKSIDV